MVEAGLVVKETIEKLSREDFHRLFVGNICQKAEFSHLVMADAADLSDDEKEVVLKDLAQFIPKGATLSNDDLDAIAIAVASRSVKLR